MPISKQAKGFLQARSPPVLFHLWVAQCNLTLCLQVLEKGSLSEVWWDVPFRHWHWPLCEAYLSSRQHCCISTQCPSECALLLHQSLVWHSYSECQMSNRSEGNDRNMWRMYHTENILDTHSLKKKKKKLVVMTLWNRQLVYLSLV